MSTPNEDDAPPEVDAPRRDNWGQRHGAMLLLAAFGLLTMSLVMYEALSR